MIHRQLLAGLCAATALTLGACGNRTIRLDFVPTESRLQPETIESSDAGIFNNDKIAMVTVSGTIANAKASSLLSEGSNPVSDFRETLDAIARDPSIKAVLLRINSPGGTVTASAMMYNDVLEFKKKTGKPVVCCMMDLCASGGYYLSCASDYRIAYPTTITGSIGVIIEAVNINGTLHKIGVATEAVKSGPNKDMLSPFKAPAADPDKPLTEKDRELVQAMINQFYAGFKAVAKASPNHVAEKDWDMLTDGRVVSGKDAAALGLIDEVGTIDTAFDKAKQLAHIEHAKIVVFTRKDSTVGSVYARSPMSSQPQQVNMVNLNVDLGDIIPHGQSEFLYMWTGFGGGD